MTVTADYKGRQTDIQVLNVTPVDGVIPVTLSITESVKKLTGVQKAIQRWCVLVLSELGTVKFAESQGAVLSRLILGGSVSSTSQLQHLLHVASADAIEAMQADDKMELFGTQPLDEKIVSVEFEGIEIDYTTKTAYATASILTEAGAGTTFVLPIQ